MWKYVTRRFRDTFERSANHFDKRPTTNVVNTTNIVEEKKKPCSDGGVPCPIQAWFRNRNCTRKARFSRNTNNNKWNFEQLNRTWIGAITWSSALALGWYASQFIHLKIKHGLRQENRCINVNNLIATLKPYVNSVSNKTLLSNSNTVRLDRILEEFTPTVHLVANDQSGVNEPATSSAASTTPDSSESDLGDVLNSIENRLGLAAIESGQHQVGLNLLRSAANRHHAPAIYNLGLCYEMGLGVTINEKTAMELYKSAAALQHPGALYNLGIYYGQGRGGLPCDPDTATRLLRLAAVQGQKDAVNALKALEVEIEPPRVEIDDTWLNHHNPLLMNDGIVPPAQLSLFVENLFFAPALHKSKDTVY